MRRFYFTAAYTRTCTMRPHTLFFLFLKIFFAIQFILVVFGWHSEDSTMYLLTDFIFKTALGIFLMIYFYIHEIPKMYYWDKVAISFAGALLTYDSVYNVLPKLLLHYDIVFNPFSLMNMFSNVVKTVGETVTHPPQMLSQ